MGNRTTVYNKIVTQEILDNILDDNKILTDDFIEYLQSIDRSPETIKQYKNDLNIFWCWNYTNNKNKQFIKISKREFAKFQNHCLNEWGWSSNRVRRVKSVISSLSNFIENILDEEEEFAGYRSVIKKIESPAKEEVREKSIFEPQELQALLDILVKNKKYNQACMLALAMYSGRRKAELPRFKVSYFDDENVFLGSLYKTPEKVKTKGRGSRGKMLNLYVLKKEFDPYLNLWLNERKTLGIDDSEWLFPANGDSASPMKVDTLDSWANTFTKILGKEFYWHSMRHFFCTQCLKKNLPSSVVQEIVGWESADMVNLYNDTTTEETLAKYFDENGIKDVKQEKLSNL